MAQHSPVAGPEPLVSEVFAGFDFATLSPGDQYKLLASTILPRPIAWVVTREKQGTLNAAPFSFFNVLSADPPLVGISFSAAPDREGKDSLTNLRASGEFVVNLVPEELAEAMNITAANAPRGTDETVLAGLTMVPSTRVNVPRIADSPVALECELFREIETGGSSTIVLGRVLYMHVRRSAFLDFERLYLDSGRLRLIGRMEAPSSYSTTRDVFTLERKNWPL